MADKDIVLAYLENIRLQATADYVRRGRQLVDADTEELKQGWISEFRRWVGSLGTGDKIDQRPREDIESELQLRKTEPPFDLVQDELEKMQKASTAHTDQLLRDPLKLAQKEREVSEEIEAFRRSIDDATRN
jgi:hypothetical protein